VVAAWQRLAWLRYNIKTYDAAVGSIVFPGSYFVEGALHYLTLDVVGIFILGFLHGEKPCVVAVGEARLSWSRIQLRKQCKFQNARWRWDKKFQCWPLTAKVGLRYRQWH
jgi:hypothetical protein